MSGWIVATNCRDGHRLAFPAASTTITYDRGLIDGVRDYMTEVSRTEFHAPDLEGAPDELQGLGEQSRAAANNTREQARITAKTMQVADALVTVASGQSFPIRDICYTEDFNDLARLTGGTSTLVPSLGRSKRPGR